MNLPKSPGALLCNLSKIPLDGTKSLQATQKRDYNDEDEFMHVSTRNYYMTRICTAREDGSTFILHRYIDKHSQAFRTNLIVVHMPVTRECS